MHSEGDAEEAATDVDSKVPSMVSGHGVPTPDIAAGSAAAASPPKVAATVVGVAVGGLGAGELVAPGRSAASRPSVVSSLARPVASAADPLPSLLGDESSDSEGAEVTVRAGPSAPGTMAPAGAVAPSSSAQVAKAAEEEGEKKDMEEEEVLLYSSSRPVSFRPRVEINMEADKDDLVLRKSLPSAPFWLLSLYLWLLTSVYFYF